MVRRTLEASYRDIGSKKADMRLMALRDLLSYARDREDDRERTTRALAGMLEDENAGLRAESLSALCELEATGALPRMITSIEDADPYVRQMAVRALGELGDCRALGRITRALEDERPEVRYQATIAFSRLSKDAGDKVGAIVARIADSDAEVAHIALRVAEEWLDEEGVAPEPLSRAAATRLSDVATGPGAAVVLAASIYVAKSAVRVGGASAAASVDERALATLRAVAANRFASDLPEEDECEALELCGETKLTGAATDLEKRAFGLRRILAGAQAHAACVALALLGDERAREKLRTTLRKTKLDGPHHERAVLGAARARLPEADAPLAELIAREPDNRSLRRLLERLRSEPSAASAAAEAS